VPDVGTRNPVIAPVNSCVICRGSRNNHTDPAHRMSASFGPRVDGRHADATRFTRVLSDLPHSRADRADCLAPPTDARNITTPDARSVQDRAKGPTSGGSLRPRVWSRVCSNDLWGSERSRTIRNSAPPPGPVGACQTAQAGATRYRRRTGRAANCCATAQASRIPRGCTRCSSQTKHQPLERGKYTPCSSASNRSHRPRGPTEANNPTT
jgi:hypothetical protein